MGKSRVFGGKCIGLLATSEESQGLLSWKTLQISFTWGDSTFSGPLPKSGMIQNGQLFELKILGPITEEPDGSVSPILPTPTRDQRMVRYKQGGRSLQTAVMEMLPTPTAHEHKYRLKGNTQASKCLEAMARNGTFGKKERLNPHFVQWMMGFPKGWLD